MIKPQANVCFEVSFECGNKVGGIYTVLKSKARSMLKVYGNNYYALGFFNPSTYFNDFIESETPEDFSTVFEKLKREGIKCYYGRWFVANNANLILIDACEFREKEAIYKTKFETLRARNVDVIKRILWEKYGIDSLRAGFDYDEPVAWAVAAGKLIEELLKLERFKDRKIVVHFHEWLSGAGLLYLRYRNLPVGLVFTTHATRIGRAKSERGENLLAEVYENLNKGVYFDDTQAYYYGLEAQHMLEQCSAKYADVFTVVSDVTKDEAIYFLKKEADIVTPNALDFDEFITPRAIAYLHEKYRAKINDFLEAYFSPYYPIDTTDSLIYFTSGRYEFWNKGIDLFIDALAELNRRLYNLGITKQIFAFILVPSNIKGPKESVLRAIIEYQRLDSLIEEKFKEIRDEIIDKILQNKDIRLEELLGRDFKAKITVISRYFSRLRGKNPPLCAFELNYDENNDLIINYLRRAGLTNKPEDRVKVIYYPCYLSPTDGLLGMDYQDFVVGASMGVFPSRYEPWGYTPFETAALRTVAITTDVSGFGRFIMRYIEDPLKSPIKVVKMVNRTRNEIVNDLANIMFEHMQLRPEERLEMKLRARELVEMLDWRVQINNYIKAHNLAIERMRSRNDRI